jgi:type II secretory pathway component PulJ
VAKQDKKQVAQEVVNLMSNGGPFPGLWKGEPMDADEVVEYVEKNKCLPRQFGHEKNSLEMQNTHHKISRRVSRLAEED